MSGSNWSIRWLLTSGVLRVRRASPVSAVGPGVAAAGAGGGSSGRARGAGGGAEGSGRTPG
ncbi:hypothetical protein, partial [Streptosporangium minutum]|uniref:hypothetical protein n=1 Tax=Streptosporangium minutum TaxID=569862 RepID=UPI0024181A2F